VRDAALAALLVAGPAVPLVALAAARAPSRAALAVCLVPLSLPVGQRVLPGAPLHLVQLAAAGAVVLAWLSRSPTDRGPADRRRPPVPALLPVAGCAVLSALLSTVVAVDPGGALRLDAGYLLGLALAWVVGWACPDLRSVRAIVVAVCAVGAAVCAAGVATAPRPREHFGGNVVDDRTTGMFGQPNELGSFAAAVAVLGLALLLAAPRRHRTQALVGLAAAGLGGAALLASLSRGGWIGAAVGLLVLLGLLDVRARRRLTAGLLAVAVAVLPVGAVLPGQPVLAIAADRIAALVAGQRGPYEERAAIWREALRQWQARPLLGVGPGGYRVLAARGGGPLATTRPEHAHSLVLTLAAEQGLVGLTALTALVVAGGLAVTRSARRLPGRGGGGARELLAGAAAAPATVLGQGLVDYPLRNPVLVMLTWLLVGVLAAALAAARRPTRPVPAPPLPPSALVTVPRPLAVARAASAGLADMSRRNSP